MQRRWFRTALWAGLMLLGTLTVPPIAAAVDEQAEHEALRSLKTLYEKAVNEERVALLAPALAPNFTGVSI